MAVPIILSLTDILNLIEKTWMVQLPCFINFLITLAPLQFTQS